VLSCVNAVAISWAGINAQAYVTATTFMVLANLNKFVVIGFGILVLQEASSWQAVIGCCCALGGGVMYARDRANLSTKVHTIAKDQVEPLAGSKSEESDDEYPA